MANSSTLSITKESSTTSSSSSSSSSMQEKTLKGLGNLIRLLPTGTVFVFQFLNPVLTNNGGRCHPVNKYLSGILIGLCGLSCGLSCFTDSYVDSNGVTHYGIATLTGLWPAAKSGSVDLSSYKLKIGDFIHAFLSLIVFAVLSLLDTNTVNCFYPSFTNTEKVLLLQVLPPVIGTVAGGVFVLFPNKRHGIGYPASTNVSSKSSS